MNDETKRTGLDPGVQLDMQIAKEFKAMMQEIAELKATIAERDERIAELEDALQTAAPYIPPFLNFGQNEEGRRKHAAMMRQVEDAIRGIDQ